MTPAGLAVVGTALQDPLEERAPTPAVLPPELEARLRASPAAWTSFEGLPPSHRRRYIGWITEARRERTRLGRLAEAIDRLSRGEPLGLE